MVGRRAVLLTVAWWLAAPAGHGAVAPFGDGDTVCWVGDSITKGGHYQTLVELAYATRYPDRRIRWYNCGVGGDRAASMLDAAGYRVAVDVLGHRPTVCTLMLGMNDVERQLYEPGRAGPQIEMQRAAALHVYEDSLGKLVVALQAGGARVILLTPSIYDDTARLARPAAVGVNGALARCGEIVARLALTLHADLVDCWTPMNAINQREQARDPAWSLVGAGQNWNDRVHPGPAGQFVIAHCLLRAQGFGDAEPDLTQVTGRAPLVGALPAAALTLAEQRRRTGESLRELATFRYAMARERLPVTDDAAFGRWLADKRAQCEAEGQRAPWLELVQRLLPREADLRQEYDDLALRVSNACRTAAR